MLSVIGLSITALGTVLAIVHPHIGGRFSGKRSRRKEKWLRLRYYIGITMIIVGTALQIVYALLSTN